MPFLGSQPAETALTTGDLGDDIVTLAKLASGTDGNLITYDASGDPAAVAVGTAGHFLKSQGAGSVPVFAAVAGAGIVWLARATLAGAATYDFESVLSSSYDSYLFVMNGVHISGANSFGARVSTDNGSTYYNSSGNYHTHTIGGDSGATTDNRLANETQTEIPLADTNLRGLDTDAAHAYGGTFQLFDVNSTVHNKFMIYQSGHYDNEGDCAMTMGACMLNATVNIDAVQFVLDTGTMDEGTIDCYAYAKS